MNDPLLRLVSRGEEEFATEASVRTALEEAEALDPLPASDRILPHLPEKGMTAGLHRLLARALETEGREKEADEVLLALAERLNQAGFWNVLARVAGLLLDRQASRAAPLIARARARGGDAVSEELLQRAHQAIPGHGVLAWQHAEARLGRGETEAARKTAATALPRLIEEKNYGTAEMALLLLSEGEASVPVAPICRALELLGRQEAWEPLATLLDLVGDHLATEAASTLAWPALREIWRRHPDEDVLRPWVVRLARGYLQRYPEPSTMLRVSEVERPSQGPDVVLGRLDRLEKFPPGYYARHSGWGIGRIRENDTEALIIDFPEKPRHRMTLGTADLALDRLDPGHIEVLLVHDPQRLKAMKKDDPVELVVRALHCLPDGQGGGEAIRKILVPRVLSSASWAVWWKGLQNELLADDRVDTRNAYRNQYRLRQEGEEHDEVPLPDWDVKKDILKNLGVLDRFRTQHPGEEARLLEGFGDRLTGILEGPATPAEKAAVELWLARVDPETPRDPGRHLGDGFDIHVLGKQDQEQLLGLLPHSESRIPLLDSRLVGIRRSAWQSIRDAGREAEAVDGIVEEPTRRPEATLFLLELDPGEVPAGTAKLLLALLEILERPPRDSHRKRALGLLEPGSPLETRLRSTSVGEEDQAAIAGRLQRWQSSDRFRFPVLDLLRRTGNAAIADAVEDARARQAARISDRVDYPSEDPYAGVHLLTRPTLQRLETERRRVGMELKTTIPRIIQKAREHGDLKENAEYDAAKAKQAAFAKRFEELEQLIHGARLIEELPREPGVVAPGTEVELEAVDGEPRRERYWILGEGDQEVGEGVVSYLAPLGQALAGLRVNDEVSLPHNEKPVRYRIRTVTERLP